MPLHSLQPFAITKTIKAVAPFAQEAYHPSPGLCYKVLVQVSSQTKHEAHNVRYYGRLVEAS